MARKYFIVYETRCTINNKIYRGAHECTSLGDGYLGSGRIFKRALKAYGPGTFTRSIIEFCSSREEMYEREKFWVDEAFVARHDTYNMIVGGLGGNSMSGHTQSPESIALRVSKTTGKKRTPEQRARIAASHIGNKNRLGKLFSDESKKKISATLIGRKLSDDVKKKMSESQKRKLAKAKEVLHGNTR